MTTTATKNKTVLGIQGPGSNHWVGDGFPVRNLFPSNGVDSQIKFVALAAEAWPASKRATCPRSTRVIFRFRARTSSNA